MLGTISTTMVSAARDSSDSLKKGGSGVVAMGAYFLQHICNVTLLLSPVYCTVYMYYQYVNIV